MTTVLVTAPYLSDITNRFRPLFEHYQLDVILAKVDERMGEEEILAYAGQFDGAMCGDDRYTRRALQACLPRLKVLAKWGTGIDSIDSAAAAELGIQVRNTPNAFTLPVADTVMGYMLAFARRQPWMDRAVKAGRWEKMPGRSLSECTLGVIGIGNIGKAVIRRARAFGMRLLGTDIAPIATDFLAETRLEMVSLETLMRESDFVSVNCDLNPTSFHLINAKSLGWMKPEGVLINSARGPLVDEPALVQALQNGRIAGAALDVYEVEPLPADSPLRGLDNVMLATHNANSSPAAWEHVHFNTFKNLLEGLGLDVSDLDRYFK